MNSRHLDCPTPIARTPICPSAAPRRVGLMLVGLALILFGVLVSPALAQKKYDPEHPEVLAMIERGLGFIEQDPSRDFGQRVLYAMAAYKAGILTSPTPKDHFLIDNALAVTEELTAARLENKQSFRTMYASALAAVFLLELDADKYADTIQILLDHIADRQQDAGAWGYNDYPNVGDTSQMQYIALALWLAKQQGFRVSPQMCKRAIEWMAEWQEDDGGWIYQNPPGIVPSQGPGAREVRHSLVAAGLGTVYLYADTLQLFDKSQGKAMAAMRDDLYDELPAAVMDITNEGEAATSTTKRKPLASVNGGQIRGVMNKGNSWFARNFEIEVERYNLYYLYGFERYISMRRYLDGDIGRAGGMDEWYDRGVEFLKDIQQSDGRFESNEGDITDAVNTAFGVLFLTQSMSLTLDANHSSDLTGFGDWQNSQNVILAERQDGGIRRGSIEQSLGDFLELMENSEDNELTLFAESLVESDLDGDEVSRAQHLAQLRMLVRHENWKARLIAIKHLAKQRSMDNVPALIFALTDPDPEIVHEANRGLMFVSRKTSGPTLSEAPTKSEKSNAVRSWTEWYQRVQPDGELLELPEEYANN